MDGICDACDEEKRISAMTGLCRKCSDKAAEKVRLDKLTGSPRTHNTPGDTPAVQSHRVENYEHPASAGGAPPGDSTSF